MDEPKIIEKKEEVSLPSLNVSVNLPAEQKEKAELVKPEQILGYCDEIFDDIREDRREIDEICKSFLDMVMNEGDATTSSKEALVNLLKLKSDTADKKTKVFDLMMRAFLKEKDTFPRYLAAHQHNEIKITDSSDKRKLLKSFEEKNDGQN
jgi:hypothetical protein